MRKQRPPFATGCNSNSDNWYDLFEDWALIEASFAKQYHIRLRDEEDMSWDEFANLLSGLDSDTPLGHIVSIRAENDSEKLKNFSAEERRIRNEWRTKHRKVITDKAECAQAMEGFKQMFLSLAK